VTTKSLIVVGIAMVILSAGNWTQASVCEIANGSFESDGPVSDVTKQEPNGWTVNIPADKFGGEIDAMWATDGSFSLAVFSQWFTTFTAADLATVSQQVNLIDANEIKFDLKLDTSLGTEWDPNKCTAVVMIDDDVVWQSNNVGSDVRGQYLDQTYTVQNKYRDQALHKLSFGLRVNVAEMLFDYYIARWDSIECMSFPDGVSFLSGDINRDYYVDTGDLNLLAEAWLDRVPLEHSYNLFRGDDVVVGYGTINLLDFAVFAGVWERNGYDLGMFAEKWLNEVDPNDQYNLFRGDNVAPSGIVNFFDLAILADTWMGSSYEQQQ